MSTAIALLLVGSSLQTPLPQGAVPYEGDGGGYRVGGMQAAGRAPGFGRSQGGDDSRYGFNIVDTPERYGYNANYPGGRASFYLLGPNRGPGK